MKRVLFLLTLLLLIITLSSCTKPNGNDEKLEFEMLSDGTYEVRVKDISVSGSINIPSTYKGISVTTLCDEAFAYCDQITSVTIPDSVKSIGSKAFYRCEGMTSVDIPESVTSIGDGAFYGCRKLVNVNIPYEVTSISCFDFKGSGSLINIEVQENNDNFKSIDGILYNKDGTVLICCPAGKTGDLIIPNSVNTIGKGAFYGCRNIKSVTIPDCVTKIDSYTFSLCDSLESISIPDSIISVGADAFTFCVNINTVKYRGDASGWSLMQIDSGNKHLENADVIFEQKRQGTVRNH